VLVRDPEKAAKLLGDDVEIARGDFTDAASLDAAMEDVDCALLLTPPSQDQVELQKSFIDAAARNRLRHVVKYSAAGADTGSASTFARQHGQSEQHLRDSGIGWTMLRPSFFMQNLLGLKSMLAGGAIYMPTGNGRAPFVDVRDIAAVAAQVLNNPAAHAGRVYDITGPQSLSYSDVADIFARVLGREIRYTEVPPAQAKQGMMQMGMPEWLADAINQLSEGMKKGQFDRVTNIVRDVGKKEPTAVEQFVRENAAQFQ